MAKNEVMHKGTAGKYKQQGSGVSDTVEIRPKVTNEREKETIKERLKFTFMTKQYGSLCTKEGARTS